MLVNNAINNKHIITFGWATRQGNSLAPESHRDLAHISFNLISDNCYVKKNEHYFELLKEQVAHVDDPDLEGKTFKLPFSSHFISAKSGKSVLGTRDTALKKFLKYMKKTFKFYKKSMKNQLENPQKSTTQLNKSVISLENALHYFQDMGQPDHTTTESLLDSIIKGKRHIAFETFAGNKLKTFLYSYDESAITTLLKEKTIKDDFKRLMRKAGLNISKKNNFNKKALKLSHLLIYLNSRQAPLLGDNKNWQNVAETSLKNTINFTATLLIDFFKKLSKI